MEPVEQLRHLARLYGLRGDADAALECYRKIAELEPSAAACNRLGLACLERGRVEEAIAGFARAVALAPDDPDAFFNLGLAYHAGRRFGEAVVCFRRVLALGDESPGTYLSLGSAWLAAGEISAALGCYRQAVAGDPDCLPAYLGLGEIYRSRGESDLAISAYRAILQRQPDHPAALKALAGVYENCRRSDEARDCYRRLLAGNPDDAESLRNLGEILSDQGEVEEAVACFEKSLALVPDPGLAVRLALVLPVISESREAITFYRRRLRNKLAELTRQGIELQDPCREVGVTAFLLAYHNLNDKEIQQEIASFYLAACPALEWVAPHCLAPRPLREKIRLGFISTCLHSHTIGHLFRGLIEHFSKDDFEIVVLRFSGTYDILSEIIDRAADRVVTLPAELFPAREMIAAVELDALFYLDIGMVPITYFLAFSRLAPVQCKRGHPVTSGIPNLDYFLSCAASEPPEAEQHYSEKLVRLETYGYYYYPPEVPAPLRSRADFGLPPEAALYVCPQTLFKFHPDFDSLFAAILHRDPRGVLVLIAGKEKNWSRLLRRRFSASFGKALARVIFLEVMPHPDFLALCKVADAVLDTPGFTGGKITLDCFAMGVPIVTLPGPFMRGRLTLAQYRLLGIDDCVAGNRQEFVDLAIKLAHDREWKREIAERILSRSRALIENPAAVREVEDFFRQAVAQRGNGAI